MSALGLAPTSAPGLCRYSTVGGSDSFGVNLRSTEDYLGLIVQSRKLCDEAEGMMPLKRGPYDKAVDKVHCFMYGIPYNYWGQYAPLPSATSAQDLATSAPGLGHICAGTCGRYLTIEAFLYGTVGYALLASVVVSCVFLVLEQRAAGANWASVFVSAIFGSAMVIIVLWLTVMTVIGLLGWANIPQSAITAMTCLMSVRAPPAPPHCKRNADARPFLPLDHMRACGTHFATLGAA